MNTQVYKLCRQQIVKYIHKPKRTETEKTDCSKNNKIDYAMSLWPPHNQSEDWKFVEPTDVGGGCQSSDSRSVRPPNMQSSDWLSLGGEAAPISTASPQHAVF